jgi:hypothetical protein
MRNVNIRTKLSIIGILAALSFLIPLSHSIPAFSSDNHGEDVSDVAKQQSAGGVNNQEETTLAQQATGGAHFGDEPDQFDCQSGDPELSHPGSCSESIKDQGRGFVSPTARGER